MYTIKPILTPLKIELPTCMYHVKSRSVLMESNEKLCKDNEMFDSDISKQVANIIKQQERLSIMDSLEKRQEAILQQLVELKQQLMSMHSELKICGKTVENSGAKVITPKKYSQEDLQDVVINACHRNIPYSLLVLKQLWSSEVCLNITCYTHSSIPALSEEAKAFQAYLLNMLTEQTKYQLNVTLIWKHVGVNPEMILSPTSHVPIYGEVNIIRYLTRIGPNDLNYEKTERANETDLILDICYKLSNNVVEKDRPNQIESLISLLNKDQFFGGQSISVADLAVFSTIKNNHVKIPKNITAKLSKWTQNINVYCKI